MAVLVKTMCGRVLPLTPAMRLGIICGRSFKCGFANGFTSGQSAMLGRLHSMIGTLRIQPLREVADSRAALAKATPSSPDGEE